MTTLRILKTLCLMLFVLALTACAGKPESVIETFYQATAKGDIEKATEQISFADVSANEMVMAKGKVQMIVGEMQNRITANDGIAKIEILESTVADDGQSAKVRTKIIFKNGKDQSENHKLVNEDSQWKIKL